MKPIALLVAATALLLTACATPGRYATANVVNQYGAAPTVVERIAQGARLSVGDVAEMGRSGVPDAVILDTLRARNDVYRLTTSHVSQLQEAGVGAPVMGSRPDCGFGKAMISRMLSSPARMATRRSIPKANPPWGGAP